MIMVVMNWNVGAQVTHCTMCELKVHMYSILGFQNNDKDLPTQAPSQNIPSIDKESMKILFIKIVMYVC